MPSPHTQALPGVDRSLAGACRSFHALGPRAYYELLREVRAEHPVVGEFLRRP